MNQLWYVRAAALGGLTFNLLVFFYVSFSWLIFGYFAPNSPPMLRGRTLIDVLIEYFTFAPPHFLFVIGAVWALTSEALVRWRKSLFFGLILSYILSPLLTFALLFTFADIDNSGNLSGDLKDIVSLLTSSSLFIGY